MSKYRALPDEWRSKIADRAATILGPIIAWHLTCKPDEKLPEHGGRMDEYIRQSINIAIHLEHITAESRMSDYMPFPMPMSRSRGTMAWIENGSERKDEPEVAN